MFGLTGAKKKSNRCGDLQRGFHFILKRKQHSMRKALVSESVISVFM